MRLLGVLLIVAATALTSVPHLLRGGSWKDVARAEHEWMWLSGLVMTLAMCVAAVQMFWELHWSVGAVVMFFAGVIFTCSIARLRGVLPPAEAEPTPEGAVRGG